MGIPANTVRHFRLGRGLGWLDRSAGGHGIFGVVVGGLVGRSRQPGPYAWPRGPEHGQRIGQVPLDVAVYGVAGQIVTANQGQGIAYDGEGV